MAACITCLSGTVCWRASLRQSSYSGEVVNASPEFEVCRNIARQHRVPLKQVMQEAMRAWAESQASPNPAKKER